MGKLNLLHHKSYHPYKAENVAKVLADEAKAASLDQESDRKSMLADSEARLDRMRKKSHKKDREGQGEGEKELAKQLRGQSDTTREDRNSNGSKIIRPDRKGKGREVEGEMGPPELSKQQSGGHINFWSEFEAGGKTTAVNLEAAIEKTREIEKITDQTKVYLAKKGEGDPKGWYASKDGKTEQERKEGVEGKLERAYKDGEHKRLSDPLAMMNSYLKRRTDIITGAPIRPAYPNSNRNNNHERYPSAAPSSSNGGDLSPIITSLLAPRRRKGEAPAPVPSSSSTSSHYRPSSSPSSSLTSSTSSTIQLESISRTTSERSRAQELIAASRRAARSSSSSTIDTPGSTSSRSTSNDVGFGLFNRDETREAGERRRGGGFGAAGGGGGWMERKEERRGRESNASRWGGR